MILYAILGSLVLALLTGGAGFWKGNEHGKASVQADWNAQKDKDRKAIDDANTNANAAAELYEEAKAKQVTRTVYVTKEVSHALAAEPVWSGVPIPDGVRRAIAAAGSASAPAQPDGTVRVPAAGGTDERPTGTGLRLGPRQPGGLFGKAQSLGPGS